MRDEIYDCITDSAKRRFDYDSFEESYGLYADNVLFSILVNLVNGDEPSIIAAKIINEFLLTGYTFDMDEIERFITENKDVLAKEVSTLKMAEGMLRSGFALEEDVLQLVNNMLA